MFLAETLKSRKERLSRLHHVVVPSGSSQILDMQEEMEMEEEEEKEEQRKTVEEEKKKLLSEPSRPRNFSVGFIRASF